MKRKLGSKVWSMRVNKPESNMIVESIEHMNTLKTGTDVYYKLSTGFCGCDVTVNEDCIFDTKEELLQSITGE